MISSGRRQNAREVCKEITTSLQAFQLVCLKALADKLAQPPWWLSDKPCKSAAFRGRSLFTGSIRTGVCSLVRRSSPPKLLEGAYVWRATGGLRGFRSCVGEQAWRLLPFDAGERREGEFGQAVEQRETWSRDHTPEVSRGAHGRNRLGRTFRLPWLRAELADQGIRRAPGTWTGQDFPLTP
jgi:hypothetical protein